MASGRVNIEEVYASATKIGQEFQRVIEQHGQDVVSDLLPLVVEALEQLEHVVEEVTELHSENGKLSLEASRLQAETEARQNLTKEKKNLKELLALKEKEIKEYKDKVDHLQTTADELTTKLRTQEMAVSEAGVEYKELQQQIKDCEKQLAEKDTLLKEKTKQLKHREKGVKENSDSSAQVQEDLARLEAKLETVQGKLEEKTKQSVEKDQKIKQLRKQLDEQKAKIGQEVTQLSTYQQKVGKLEKQLDDYTKQLEVMNRQQRRLDEKFKKSAGENQSLRVKIMELEQQLESKNKQVGEKSKRIQELSKQLDEQIALNEQQNGDQHSVNKRESTAEVTALNDRVAELEEEVERVKSSTLKRTEPPTEQVEEKFSKQSVSEVGAVTKLSNTTSEQPSTAVVPEFYRSDLLQVLQEKTDYMTKLFNVEEENEVLKQQLTSILERQNTQPKRRKTISSKESGVRSIMDKTVTLKRDGSSSLPRQ